MNPAEDPLAQARAWMGEGLAVALATVVETWGSAPRPAGSQLAVNARGAFAGSVSGGCIENFLISEALDVIAEGEPQLLSYGVSDAQAQEVRLACGGTIRVYVERIADTVVLDALIERRPIARVVDLADGASLLLDDSGPSGDMALDAEAAAAARGLLSAGASGLLSVGGRSYLVVSYTPPWRLIVVGAVHIAQALAPMAAAVGLATTVVDPRPAFARPERLPGVTIVTMPPDKAFRELAADAHTAIVALAHDPILDDPALKAALASDAYYIGCLGSRRTHAKRLDRLRAAGFTDADLARLHGPVGLDIGARAPGEIAVSILAEAIAARYGKAGRR